MGLNPGKVKTFFLSCSYHIVILNYYYKYYPVLPFRMAEAHSWTCTSGILLASCIAGVTMFILSRLLPSDKKMWPSNTKEHDVKRFRSSAFAIFSVSRKYRLHSSTSHIHSSLSHILVPIQKVHR